MLRVSLFRRFAERPPLPQRFREILLRMTRDATQKPDSWRADSDDFSGVTYSEEKGAVTRINCAYFSRILVAGKLDLSVLTNADFPALETLSLRGRPSAETTVDDFGRLPRSLRHISFGHSGIAGTLDLAALPPKLTFLDIRDCHFKGKLDWTQFERLRELKEFDCSGNKQLTGDVSFKHLPPKLACLDIKNCSFTGVGNLSDLPASLHTLRHRSECCRLSLVADFTRLPTSLCCLDVFGDNTSCVTDTSSTGKRISLEMFADILRLLRKHKHKKTIGHNEAEALAHAVANNVRAPVTAERDTYKAERDKLNAELQAVRAEFEAARGAAAKN
jgi:hypothetical protein